MNGSAGTKLQLNLRRKYPNRRSKPGTESYLDVAKIVKKISLQNANDFCNNTTLHGFRYINNPNLSAFEKLFFVVSVLAVLLISGFFISIIYNKWSTTPVIFGINPEPTFIREQPFPAVTICNMNQASLAKVQNISKASGEYEMLRILCKYNISDPNKTLDWNNFEDFVIANSQRCDQMLIRCWFGGKVHNCAEIFRTVLTDEGLCCVFNIIHPKFMFNYNIPKTLKFSKPSMYSPVDWNAEQGYPETLPPLFYPHPTQGVGESVGLSLVLDVQDNDYYCPSANSVGFKLSLHQPNELSNLRETGILIAPGYETKIRITPEKLQSDRSLLSINAKHRFCIFRSEKQLKYFRHYTQRNCEIECLTEQLLRHCHCRFYHMPSVNGNTSSTCSPDDLGCMRQIVHPNNLKKNTCRERCLPSCNEFNFKPDAFPARITTLGRAIRDITDANISGQYVRRSISIVHLYYRALSYRSIKQTEFVSLTDFLSSVGGLMGLFIGFSFISIAEFLYFTIIRPCRMLSQRKRPKRVNDLHSKHAKRMHGISVRMHQRFLHELSTTHPMKVPRGQPFLLSTISPVEDPRKPNVVW